MNKHKFKNNEEYTLKEFVPYLLENFKGRGFEKYLEERISKIKESCVEEDIKFVINDKSYRMTKKLSKLPLINPTIFINGISGNFVLYFNNTEYELSCTLLPNNKVQIRTYFKGMNQ